MERSESFRNSDCGRIGRASMLLTFLTMENSTRVPFCSSLLPMHFEKERENDVL